MTVVRVPVATLFTGPDVVRAVDAPALGPAPDVAAWAAGLGDVEWMGKGVLTQLLLGEQVLVEEVADSWARVVATDQPAARLDPRGYPGWLPLDQLAEGDPGEADHVVDAETTTLYDRPDGQPVLTGVVLGTRVAAAGESVDGWLPVRVPGGATGWAPVRDLTPLPQGSWSGSQASPDPHTDALAVAQRLVGTPYVWGGVSPYGIDCSGLVRLAWWRLGVTVPRDASDQADALPAVSLGEERPGDLYIFARPGEPVYHIGFVTADPQRFRSGSQASPNGEQRWMLHASSTQRRVVSEPMSPHATETLVGARRVTR